MGRWIKFFHGKNTNELGSELFKFVKFYSSNPLIPKLYNTIRSISKNLVSTQMRLKGNISSSVQSGCYRGYFLTSIICLIFVQKKKISKIISNFTFFTIMGSQEFWFHSQNLDQFQVSSWLSHRFNHRQLLKLQYYS